MVRNRISVIFRENAVEEEEPSGYFSDIICGDFNVHVQFYKPNSWII